MCHTYTVTVQTQKSEDIQTTLVGNKKHIVANSKASFCLLLKNDSDDHCDVSVAVGSSYLTTQSIKPKSTLTIRYKDDKSEELMFNGTFFHVTEYRPEHEVHEHSCITAVFMPMSSTTTRCVPVDDVAFDGSMSDSVVCYQDVNWNKLTVIRIPVLLL